MAKRTKKVGPVGRFGARYGVRAKSRVKNIEIHQKLKRVCPSCGHKKVKRLSTGIWQCGKCGVKFAGGAYLPKTEAGQTVEKMLRADASTPKVATNVEVELQEEVENE
ncbi:MAG: 50S ribosomal protein L37Ae [Candidatus Thermoplasmatota archaeon]|nr:50S ribosomal protein L37Ae [Candidatus Thermoplasmatota archaeon]